MIKPIGKSVDMAGTEIQLTDTEVVRVLILVVGFHDIVSSFSLLAGEGRLFLRGYRRKYMKLTVV